MAKRAYVNNGQSLNIVNAAYGSVSHGGFVYLDAVGAVTAVKQAAKEVNKTVTVYVDGRYFTSIPKHYDVYTTRIAGGYYSQIIICKEDEEMIDQAGNKSVEAYIFFEDEMSYDEESIITMCDNKAIPQGLIDGLYDKIYKMTGIPMNREWGPYFIRNLAKAGDLVRLDTVRLDEKSYLQVYSLMVPIDTLIQLEQGGTRRSQLVVSEKANNTSNLMRGINSIYDYLNAFSDVHAKHIQEVCSARFTPGVDEYSPLLKRVDDYIYFRDGIRLFDAQKSVIQGVANTLDYQDAVYIIAECGSGKSIMGTVAVVVNNKEKKAMTNVVLCPPHLVEKWKREILRAAPGSDVEIIDNFDNLLKVMPNVKCKLRRRHLWLVVSNQVAKNDYFKRPAAVWKKSATYTTKDSYGVEHRHLINGCYCCPECGQPLYTTHWERVNGVRTEVKDYFDETAFRESLASNQVCHNKVKKWNHATHQYEEQECGARLWTVATHMNERAIDCWTDHSGVFMTHDDGHAIPQWIKSGASGGWIEMTNLQAAYDKLAAKEEKKRKRYENEMMTDFSLTLSDGAPVQTAPVRFSISKYLKKYCKNDFDYFLADEVNF